MSYQAVINRLRALATADVHNQLNTNQEGKYVYKKLDCIPEKPVTLEIYSRYVEVKSSEVLSQVFQSVVSKIFLHEAELII